jgi:hydrophobic/amphiphilic exporter-1 (mainly G- bacteria), HAE1 family
MFEKFINRPVLSLVISLLFLLVGGLALTTLPVTQFPDIVPPSVTVTAKYTGANAEVCAKAVAIPIERAINGVPGMTYMTSVTSNNGVTLVTVYFNVGVDPDVAAVNVQNRVSTIIDELPEEVIKAGVITEKEVNSVLLYLNVYSDDSLTDEKFVYNYTDINLLTELKRIDGVGFAEIMGSREYSMRVWLNPEKMMTYSVSADEIIQAIRVQNVEAAPGQTGESSEKQAQMLQYTLKYSGKFTDEEQYRNIPVKTNEDGSVLRLKDVARIEFGSQSYAISSKTDGKPSASILIKQRPGSNAAEVISNIKKRMGELQQDFPPGLKFNYAYDVSRFLDASIHEVIKTLIEAFILVSLIVFLFLQDWRSTLIPALAVPVSLIGTFAFLDMLGFSINLLTLFAMVLAIGIVVDNAIVVVEAVHAKMHFKKLSPKAATVEAMSEISGAIIAITLVMSAVFVPVAFMSGPVGIFYRQFSLTLAIAIVISGINALTLTPALCAILLKQHHSNRGLVRMFFSWFNKHYDNLARKYGVLVELIASRRLITLIMLVLFFGLTWTFNNMVPSGFIPTEDQGIIYVNVTTPPGSTVERTEAVLQQVYAAAGEISAVENVSILAGYSIITEAAGASFGMAMINLKSWDEREESVDEVIEIFKQKTASISDASIEFFPPPTVPGFGNSSGFELRLIDKSGTDDLNYTAKVTNEFIEKLEQKPAIKGAFTSFDVNFPQYELIVDHDMAARKGVSVDKVMSELQTLVGSMYTSNFIRYSQMYKVMVQASP